MASAETGVEQRDQMIGEKRRDMRWKFIGEQAWLQEALLEGRGSESKAFGLPGVEAELPFESPVELHCHHAKLAVGRLPFCSVLAHSCPHSLSLHGCCLAKTGWNLKTVHAEHQSSHIYNN